VKFLFGGDDQGCGGEEEATTRRNQATSFLSIFLSIFLQSSCIYLLSFNKDDFHEQLNLYFLSWMMLVDVVVLMMNS